MKIEYEVETALQTPHPVRNQAGNPFSYKERRDQITGKIGII